MQKILSHKIINNWNLFWLLSIPMSVNIFLVMLQHDMSNPKEVSDMIGYSVRWAVPLIFIVTAASAMQILFANDFTRWWLKNRKYIGMCFAVAMAWQGSFILIISTMFRDYYFEEVYLLRNEIEGSLGYILLTVMVITSFKTGSKYISARQWKLMQKAGLYFLWAYAYSVYWWNLYYYKNPELLDHVFYWLGFTVFALRIIAWGKKRTNSINITTHSMTTIFGGSIALCGLAVAALGLHWRHLVTPWLLSPDWSAELELWLPYWPFEPFFSFFLIGIGVMIMTPSTQYIKVNT